MNVAFAPNDEPLVRRKFSADDVIRMVDTGIMRADERVELIEGELVMMASKYAPHENIKHALNRALSRAIGDDLYVAIETSLKLAEDVIVEPDLTVIACEVFQAPRLAAPKPSDVHLLIEVADTSMRYDRQIKARLYARYGIQEFWVIEAKERTTWIHTQPQGDGWGSIVEHLSSATLTSPAAPGFSIRLADI